MIKDGHEIKEMLDADRELSGKIGELKHEQDKICFDIKQRVVELGWMEFLTLDKTKLRRKTR